MLERMRSLVMRKLAPLAVAILGVFIGAGAGCHKQADANAELANAVKVLEKADPGQPPVTAPPPEAVSANAAAPPSQEAVIVQPVAQQMSQALTAYKGGNYVDAITRLQWLRTKAAKTPEQTMAIQDAMAAVMAELYARAEKGDARAQQAIKQFQETRNTR